LNPLKNYKLNESFIILAKKFYVSRKAKKEHLTPKGRLRLLFLIKFFCVREAKNYNCLE